MRAVLRELAGGAAFGCAAGLLAGAAAAALLERHPQQGLHVLALGLVARAGWICLGLALAGGAAAALLRAAGGRLAHGARARALLRTAAFATAVMPVLGWIVLGDLRLLPARRALLAAGLAGLGAALAAGFWIGERRRAGARPGPVRVGARATAAGLGFATLLGVSVAERVASRAPEGRPDILLVVLDTVRADRLSCYGNPRRTTPELDAFARDAIRFDQAYATSSWTVPSHASLFTGLFPVRHGATQEKLFLERRFATLAEVLRDAGYRTWAASGNPFVGRYGRLAQGFETFVETWRGPPAASRAIHPNNAAFEAFLRDAGRDRPFFAFVNYMDAHAPYAPPERDLRRFVPPARRARALRMAAQRWTRHYVDGPFAAADLALLSDLYDAELAYVSRSAGALLDALRRDGRFDGAWVAITSDHGEHFGENGLVEHVFGLYNTAVRVPLLLRPPGGAGRARVDERPAQLVDLFPTLLHAAGVDASAIDHHGADLLAPGGGRDEILSEYYFPAQALGVFTPRELERGAGRLARYKRRLRALQAGGRRLIWSSDGRHELYDLGADPGETHDLYEPGAPGAGALAARLERALERYGAAADVELSGEDDAVPPRADDLELGAALDGETLEALRELGYVR